MLKSALVVVMGAALVAQNGRPQAKRRNFVQERDFEALREIGMSGSNRPILRLRDGRGPGCRDRVVHVRCAVTVT